MRFARLRDARPVGRAVAFFVAAGLALAVLLGFSGDLHPAFDALGQFRAHASLALAVVALALFAVRQAAGALAALFVAVLGLWSALPFMLPQRSVAETSPDTPRYTLLQMNLRFDAPDPGAALSLIATSRPDVVTLQEVTPPWFDALERIAPAYPHRFYCRPPFVPGNVAILSRRPFLEGEAGRGTLRTVCEERDAFAAKTIDFNGMPVTVATPHLRWPWPGRQPRMVAALEPVFGRLGDPLIVAGDFNAAPWTAAVRRLARASRTRVLAGIGPTWIASLLPPSLAATIGLPIDNVLVSDGIEVLDVRTTGPTTSDHLPVLVTFTMRFALPEEPDVLSAGR